MWVDEQNLSALNHDVIVSRRTAFVIKIIRSFEREYKKNAGGDKYSTFSVGMESIINN